MNNELSLLIAQFAGLLASLTRRLRDSSIDVDTWQTEFLKLLAQYLGLALLQGANTEQLNQSQASIVANALTEQSRYLDNFAQEIRNEGWRDEYIQRSQMYAEALRPLFWDGVLDCILSVPTPGDGSSECMIWCKCHLKIEWLDQMNCDADIYWIVDPVAEHCNTCIMRGATWIPLKVRSGSIVNG